jgi:hypothetical protein
MKQKSEEYAMPIFPLILIGTMMLTIVLYLVASEALLPKPRGTRVYVQSAYGVSDEEQLTAETDRSGASFKFQTPRPAYTR